MLPLVLQPLAPIRVAAFEREAAAPKRATPMKAPQQRRGRGQCLVQRAPAVVEAEPVTPAP